MASNTTQLSLFNKISIIIHTGDSESYAMNHLRYWIPEFTKTKIEFCVLVRNELVFKTISKEFKYVTLLYATSPLDIEAVINKISTLKSIFYTSNTGNNIHLLRFIDYKHIFIGSENSDRDSKITKFIRAYDEIWMSSDAIIDKIKSEIDIGHLKCIKIGKPQLKELILKSKNHNKIGNNILYIPSDEGTSELNNYSSLNLLSQIIDELKDNFDFNIVINKKIGTRNKSFSNLKENIKDLSYKENINCNLYDKVEDDLLINTRYIICDIRSLNNKILASNTVIFLYIPEDKIIENYTLNKYMKYDFLYIFSTIEKLSQYVFDINMGNDPMKDNRIKAINYWLGIDETLTYEFTTQIKNIK